MSAPSSASPAAHGVPEPTGTRGIFDPDLLSACISCGFCLPACPTYALTQDERSSPRGRITLMRALEEGRLDERDPVLVEQASQCLGCRACETVCPAGVQYGQLLEQWRDHQWQGKDDPLIARAARAAMKVTPAITAAGTVRGAARTTGAAQEGKLHLMLGCAERATFPGISRAAVKLLGDAVDVPSGQGCCGAVLGHNGDKEGGEEMARRLGDVMPGTVVTTSGGCGAHLAHGIGRERVKEISEVLLELFSAPDAPALSTLTVDGRPARIGLQDSCQLRNGLGVTLPPRELIGRVGEYVELGSSGRCCGAAGTYSLLRKKESRAILDMHVDEVEAADLDYWVSLNVVCHQQLITGIRKRKLKTKVVHLAELLAMAV
ncbi:(Fe-S)-binding protein [Nocardioides sp. GY 10127]|uniref:(Fe-S)-binding protein n=1 Tax=Nocardioides sp. GY 10127 TaxID=2569762 RepID=UPI0010A83DFD|nr:(Fe-S)-binding protein [Nocardioides sp. GY 10127]TIC84497.1 (Fe-S)-binding protein [Nocardioides sp. GY 10127]